MIYTDNIHIVTDGNLNELHDFCQKIGIKRHWFHYHPQHPHYDVPKQYDPERIITAGGVFASSKELVVICQNNRFINEKPIIPNDNERKKNEQKAEENRREGKNDSYGEYYV